LTTLNAEVWVAIENDPIREAVERMLEAWRVTRVDTLDRHPSAIRILQGKHVEEFARGGAVVVIAGPTAPVPAGVEQVRTPLRYSDLLDALMRALGRRKPDPVSHSPGVGTLAGRVLLVDDNLVNRLVARAWLESFGLTVDEAEDGLVALESLRADHRMVFMDCQMPRLDGLEATRRIRARESTAEHVPIIAVTANAFPGDRERALAAGMDDYLAKPFSRDGLFDKAKRWLDAGPSSAKPPQPPAPAWVGPSGGWREELREILGPSDSLLVVVEAFEADCDLVLADLPAAVANGDLNALAGLLHKLKGGLTVFGQSSLLARLTDFHATVRRGETLTQRQLTELHDELAAFRVEVRKQAAQG
jgi:CheY-like chemotaxis protein